MKSAHVITAAILIGVAAGLGTYAVTRTSELGVKARTASSKDVEASIAARSHRLSVLEASMRKALARKPPALPALPKAQPQSARSTRVVAAAPTYTAPRLAVIRSASPAPAVHRGEHESEHAASGGEQDD